ncbi:MAG: hypothetical protein ACSLEX_02040 [Minisyncoccota bacterium]
MKLKHCVIASVATVTCWTSDVHADEETPQKEESWFSGSLQTTRYGQDYQPWEVYGEGELTEKLSGTVDIITAHGYTEVTAGLAYYITPNFEVGLSVGGARYLSDTDNNESIHRTIAGFVYLATDKTVTEVTVEHYADDTNPWYYQAYTEYAISDDVMVGVYGEKGPGIGPRVSWSPGEHVSLWMAVPLVDSDTETSMVGGIRITF